MPTLPTKRSPLQRLVVGAAAGAAIGSAILVFGLLRFAFFAFRGGAVEPITWADARPMVFYVAGFTLAGAFVGLARPLLRGPNRLYGVMAVAGAIVMNIIALSDRGVRGMEPTDWIAATTLGVLFGLAGAFGFLRAR